MKTSSSVNFAIALLIIGNLTASLSDVAVKVIDGEISAYQYVFLRQLLSFIIILPFWLVLSKEKQKISNIKVTMVRAHLILVGSACMMVAITFLPLATANAVFYAAPILMLPLSIVLLNERPHLSKVVLTIVGFVGVLVVLRPSNFHWAAMFALGTAMTLALFNTLARKIPQEQSIITTLFWTSLLSLPIATLLALTNWQPLNWTVVGLTASSAILILIYNGLAVLAYKKAHTSQIALAEYSGLIFVTLFGIAWFDEVPDTLTVIGILMIVLPLIPFKKLIRK